MSGWSKGDIPTMKGQRVVVTGANSGIGFEAAKALAGKGANVILACRSEERGRKALAAIEDAHPEATVELRLLDLADLGSVKAFAEGVRRDHPTLDRLINNAGVMALPLRRTADGFEMQFGTNHLGHFALTMRLLDKLLEADDARIVTVSSMAHRFGRMRWKDPNWQRGYQKWLAYGQSKLANVLFTLELQRRLEAKDTSAIAVACHPGFADTNLQFVGPKLEGSKLQTWLMKLNNEYVAQDANAGALPTLYAATAPAVRGGDFFGPDGVLGIRGTPTRETPARHARDEADAARLWALSAELTGLGTDV
jgi:NAD(P)-dependent dehydrogenase (short-subunit alcohol dehydrogenase family)